MGAGHGAAAPWWVPEGLPLPALGGSNIPKAPGAKRPSAPRPQGLAQPKITRMPLTWDLAAQMPSSNNNTRLSQAMPHHPKS